MLLDSGVYAWLLRAVLQDRVGAFIAGPNCRTRSVLRRYPRENAPRPVTELRRGKEKNMNWLI